ncbi:MAG: hypothetical protein NVSMB62_20450 [Acidobacteriaceae bacterium]
MLDPFRDEFNARFTPEAYAELRGALNRATRTEIGFPVAETPVFFARELLDEMIGAGQELTRQLMENADYMRASLAAIPELFRTANDTAHPHFMTVDFGLVLDAMGRLVPKLVELQAFPSLYGFQAMLAKQYVQTYGLSPDLRWFLGGHDEDSYWDLMRKVIVGDHSPAQVVLAEVEPLGQKTLPDFRVHEDRLGIATVDIAKIRKEGNRLFYRNADGRWIAIERIYNRAIADEMERKGVRLPFDLRDPLEVEWAGHPNWYFRISKFSLPWLVHPTVPPAVFLDQWLKDRPGGAVRSRLPENREQILLKPLYSFAGKGIQFAPTDEELAQIPAAERRNYILQERVEFQPVIRSPSGPTQTEIRILYVWPDGSPRMEPVISLARLGRGRMMGVDHNRDQRWVGSSAVLFRQG